jgi:hypothetical protein
MLAQVVLAEDGQAAHALLDLVRLPNGGEVAVDKVRGQGRECGAGNSAGSVDTSRERASIPPAEDPHRAPARESDVPLVGAEPSHRVPLLPLLIGNHSIVEIDHGVHYTRGYCTSVRPTNRYFPLDIRIFGLKKDVVIRFNAREGEYDDLDTWTAVPFDALS